jgi:hypothetical protein
MTEAEWLTCADPQPMLEYVRGKASERKLRLFACACARLVWDRLPADLLRESVETAEKYADGLVTDAERHRYVELTNNLATEAVLRTYGEPSADDSALSAARHAITPGYRFRDPAEGFSFTSSQWPTRRYHPGLLRDIFGPLPFRPVAINPRWLKWNYGTVPAVARRIYEERAFHDMPILADALEDAGYVNQEFLAHCRTGGPHVPGCWVVDLLLGKG